MGSPPEVDIAVGPFSLASSAVALGWRWCCMSVDQPLRGAERAAGFEPAPPGITWRSVLSELRPLSSLFGGDEVEVVPYTGLEPAKSLLIVNGDVHFASWSCLCEVRVLTSVFGNGV